MLRPILAALAVPALLAAQSSHKLLVISIDGLDARLLNNPALKVKTPNIRRLMRAGASATVIGVAPSETWPAHASLVTGVSPWQHGVLDNDLPAGALRMPAIWEAAARNGMKAATVYWPGTLGAKVAANIPQLQEPQRGNSVAFDTIAENSTPSNLTSLIEKAFPSFAKEIWSDSSSAQAAIYLQEAVKPDLLFVHFSEVDAEQRETGALSIYAREILENNDDLVGQVVAKAPPGTFIVIVSDHGFDNSNRTVRPRVMLKQAGVNGKVEVEEGLIGTTDEAVAVALRRKLGEGTKSGLSREIPMAEVRARAPVHAKWVAAFDTLPGYIANNEDKGAAVGPGTHLGVHQIWPTRPTYRSIFIMTGPGIKSVKLGEIDMLQIAPTLADAISVRLPAAKSASLWRQIRQ